MDPKSTTRVSCVCRARARPQVYQSPLGSCSYRYSKIELFTRTVCRVLFLLHIPFPVPSSSPTSPTIQNLGTLQLSFFFCRSALETFREILFKQLHFSPLQAITLLRKSCKSDRARSFQQEKLLRHENGWSRIRSPEEKNNSSSAVGMHSFSSICMGIT